MSGLGEHLPQTAREIWRRTVPVWVALTLLLGLTCGLAYVPLGSGNFIVALFIAVIKALLVVVFFMHLIRPDPLLRLAGSAALLWLLFMFMLTFADILTRPGPTQPGTITPRSFEAPATSGVRAF